MYAGIDCSTQSLKILLINEHHTILHQTSVHFENELKHHYKINDGITRATYGIMNEQDVLSTLSEHEQALIVTSPALMFVEALELALQKLKTQNVDFSQIIGISGSGQQHGSVYWKDGSKNILNTLDASKSLVEQLNDTFSIPNGPIWMDSSTHKQCMILQNAAGGAQALAELTGSRAYERFTGNQIMKIAQLFPELYTQTERISLVSSMVATLLLGDYAPIDASDAAGMNLMDISTQKWSDLLLKTIDPSGKAGEKLGEVAPSTAIVGKISPYYVQRYGFSPDCQIVACSGDNPCTLAGLELKEPGDVGVSLGTSDTVFAVVATPNPSGAEGHVFINPVDTSTAMIMAVWKNGSLTRQKVRDNVVGGSWELFNAALKNSTPGNDGNIVFTFLEPEITPTTHGTGTFRFNKDNQHVESFGDNLKAEGSTPTSTQCTEIRGLIEGQFLSLKAHSQHLGLDKPKRVVASGGASVNWTLLQILADVFQAPVEVQTVKDPKTGADASSMMNTAALGAAYRALWAIHGKDFESKSTNDHSTVEGQAAKVTFTTAATPRPETAAIYDALLERYKTLETTVVSQLQ